MRRLFWFVAGLATCAGLLVLGAQLARRRFERRCSLRTGGTCTVRALTLAPDGLVLAGLEVRTRGLEISAESVVVSAGWEHGPRIARLRVGPTRVSGRLDPVAWRETIEHARADSDGRGGDPPSAGAGEHIAFELDTVAGDVTLLGDRIRWSGASLRRDTGGWSAALHDGSLVRDEDLSLQFAGCSVEAPASGAPARSGRCQRISTDLDAARLDALREHLRALREAVGDGAAGARRGPGAARTSRVDFECGDTALSVRRGSSAWLRVSQAGVRAHAGPDGTSLSAEIGAGPGRPGMRFRLESGNAGAWNVSLRADGMPLADLAAEIPAVPWYRAEAGSVDVDVLAVFVPDAATAPLMLDGRVAVRNFGLSDPRLAHEPITGITVETSGRWMFDRARRRLSTTGASLALNGIRVDAAGWAEAGGGRAATDVTVTLPESACDAFRSQLPAALVGPVAQLRFGGTLGGQIHVALDTDQLPLTVLDVLLESRCVLEHDGLSRGVAELAGPFVQRVREPQGVLRAFVTGPGTPAWVPYEMLPPALVQSVVAREDGRFFEHQGFDAREIRAAIIRDLAARRFVYGASTLSMQLAKNIFLERDKILVRKLQEVAFTWYLEHSLPKDRLLELYLNVVEFGPAIYGIGPAARHYFGREPRDLNLLECAWLATLLPNPVQRSAPFARGALPDEQLQRLRDWTRGLAGRGVVGADVVAAAQSETVRFRDRRTPVAGALTQFADPTLADDTILARIPLGMQFSPEPTDVPLEVTDPPAPSEAHDTVTPAPAPPPVPTPAAPTSGPADAGLPPPSAVRPNLVPSATTPAAEPAPEESDPADPRPIRRTIRIGP